MVSYFEVSIIKRTLAWITGSLTCGVCDLFASVCTQGTSVYSKANMVLNVRRNYKAY